MGRWSSRSGLEVITLVAAVLEAEEVETGLADLLYSTPSSTKDGILDGLDLFLFKI